MFDACNKKTSSNVCTLAVVIADARELLLDSTSECFMLIALTSSLCKLNSRSVDEYINSVWPLMNFLARMYFWPVTQTRMQLLCRAHKDMS